jgi:iron(III) transport system substrate-binding protein
MFSDNGSGSTTWSRKKVMNYQGGTKMQFYYYSAQPRKCSVVHLWWCVTLCVMLFSKSAIGAAGDETAGATLRKYSTMAVGKRHEILENFAKKEGVLNVYGITQVSDARMVFDAFKKRYPYLSIEHYRAGASALASKVLGEHRAGKHDVDVIDIAGTAAHALLEAQIVDQYWSPEHEAIRPAFLSSDKLWTGFTHYLVVTGFNTETVSKKDVPKSYADLLSKKWKNSISLDQTDYDWFHLLANEWGEEKAVKFLENLMKQDPQLRRGHTLQAQLLAAGEFSIATVLYDYRVRQMKSLGAPIDAVMLSPIMARPAVLMLARHARHPHAAALYIDWASSKEGQEVVEEKLGRHSVRKDLGQTFDSLVRGRPYQAMTPEAVGDKSNHYIQLYEKITGQ